MIAKVYIYTTLKRSPIIIECESSQAEKILNDIAYKDDVLLTKVCVIYKKYIKYAIIRR